MNFEGAHFNPSCSPFSKTTQASLTPSYLVDEMPMSDEMPMPVSPVLHADAPLIAFGPLHQVGDTLLLSQFWLEARFCLTHSMKSLISGQDARADLDISCKYLHF